MRAFLVVLISLALALPAQPQLLLRQAGSGANSALTQTNANFFVSLNEAGSSGGTPIASDAATDTHGIIACPGWHTVASGVLDAALTHVTWDSSGWMQNFTSNGFNVAVSGASGSPFDGHDLGGMGLGLKVDMGTAGSNFLRCVLSSSLPSTGSMGFFFKTTATGTSAQIHDLIAFNTATNGWQYSFQFSDKASVNNAAYPSCTNTQLGIEIETSDTSTHHGTCIVITSGTQYFGEIHLDQTAGTVSAKVYTVGSCDAPGALVGTSSGTAATGDTIKNFEIGDDPNGGTAAGKVIYESNWVIGFTANAAYPFGCGQ